jgi:hypothetical protein
MMNWSSSLSLSVWSFYALSVVSRVSRIADSYFVSSLPGYGEEEEASKSNEGCSDDLDSSEEDSEKVS